MSQIGKWSIGWLAAHWATPGRAGASQDENPITATTRRISKASMAKSRRHKQLACLVALASISSAEAGNGTFFGAGWDGSGYVRTVGKGFPGGMTDKSYSIVAFGEDGVYVSTPVCNTDGCHYATGRKLTNAFSVTGGGWNDNNKFPRMLADVNKDGVDDIVGFGNDGVYVGLFNKQTNRFDDPKLWLRSFAVDQTWTDFQTFPRAVADVNGDGYADVIGFTKVNVMVALGTGSEFKTPVPWSDQLSAQWPAFDRCPRMVADMNRDGKADVVAFATEGVYVMLSTGAAFGQPAQWSSSFGERASWTSQTAAPRVLADVDGDGLPDVVGFADSGVFVAKNVGTQLWQQSQWSSQFGYKNTWTSNAKFPRYVADFNGDGRADIIGFSSEGVYVGLNLITKFDVATLYIAAYGLDSILPSWMTALRHDLLDRYVSEINVAGSHDTPTYCRDTVASAWKTQGGDISAQIAAGARYFDFRIAPPSLVAQALAQRLGQDISKNLFLYAHSESDNPTSVSVAEAVNAMVQHLSKPTTAGEYFFIDQEVAGISDDALMAYLKGQLSKVPVSNLECKFRCCSSIPC